MQGKERERAMNEDVLRIIGDNGRLELLFAGGMYLA
jgi:hypothetical protein